MSGARAEHAYLQRLFGGQDVTLLFLKRLDTSDGKERFEDFATGNVSPAQRAHLEAYLHEFAREYRHVGTVDYRGASRPVPRAPPSIRVQRWSLPEIRPRNQAV